MAAWVKSVVEPGKSLVVEYCFSNEDRPDLFENFDEIFQLRIKEADDFYTAIAPSKASDEEKKIQRQVEILFFLRQIV